MPISTNTIAKWGRIAAGLGFLLLLAAFVLRLRLLFAGTAQITEGEPFEGRLDEYIPGDLVYDEDLGLPDIAFYPTKIRATQGQDGELLGVTAHVRVPDADGRERVLSDTSPLEIGGTRVRIYRINVAPVFAVRHPLDAQPSRIVPKLTIWRPDSPEDQFRLAEDTVTAHVRLYSDFYSGPAGPGTRSMAMRDPVLDVRLVPDRSSGPSGRALLRPGDSHKFGPLELELVELRHWGAVELAGRHRNHLAYAGVLLLALGVAGQLLGWTRRRATAASRTEREV